MSCTCGQTPATPLTNCPCDSQVFPPPLNIPAALGALPRQLATFPEYRAALLAALTRRPALADWRARSSDDLGVMLLEMWAYVADALSFYDEVIADESYLRTSQRRASLRKLVGLLGYVPRPAVAAAVELAAFADGRRPVTLPAGTAFRSGAFAGGPPQVFELEAPAAIHPLLNEWELRRVRRGAIGPPAFFDLYLTTSLLLRPEGVRAKAGEVVLLRTPAGGSVRRVKSVGPHTGADGEKYTKVEFDALVLLRASTPIEQVKLYVPTAQASLWTQPTITGDPQPVDYAAWLLVLDGVYRQIRARDLILVSKDDEHRWFRVASAPVKLRQVTGPTKSEIKDKDGNVTTVTTPPVTTPVTHINLDGEASLNAASRKASAASPDWTAGDAAFLTVHYALVEAGTVTVEAATTLKRTDALVVKGRVEAPKDFPPPGAFLLEDRDGAGLALTGTLGYATGALTPDQTVEWDEPLAAPVKLYGNVVRASRGETVNGETLGSGDGSRANQSFTLRKSPLTYVPSPTAGNETGAVSTLRVYVGGVLWREASSFYGVAADAEVYVVRQNDDGASVVTFGDGVRGARLPSGVDNVVAFYRHGAGAASPPAGSVKQLAKPVQGLRSVRNPVAAGGGADAEGPEGLRTYAPRSALLLGRAVSIQDMEAAAAGVGGVRAVAAEWRWNKVKQRPLVQIYYVGEPGLDAVITQLLRGLTEPSTPINVEPAEGVEAELSLDVEIDPRYLEDDVTRNVRAALTDAGTGLLAPEHVGIGRPLFRSRIFEAVLAVEGAAVVRGLMFDGSPLLASGVTPGAGKYFDFEAGTLLLNGKA